MLTDAKSQLQAVLDKPGKFSKLPKNVQDELMAIILPDNASSKDSKITKLIKPFTTAPSVTVDDPVPYVPADLPSISTSHHVEYITPKRAQQLLTNNKVRQRSLSSSVVDKLSKDMLQKRWVFTGEPIILSKKNDVLDGQHRLSAVVKSGLTIRFLIVKGVDESSLKHMNTGRKRTAGDILKIITGTGDSNAIASTIMHYMILNANGSAKPNPTSEEYLRLFHKHRHDIHWAINTIGRKIKGSGLSVSSGCGPVWGAFAIMRHIEPARVENLAKRYVSGILNGPNDNARVLRVLAQSAVNKGSGEVRRDLFGYFLYVIDAELHRKSVNRMSVRSDSKDVFGRVHKLLGKL